MSTDWTIPAAVAQEPAPTYTRLQGSSDEELLGYVKAGHTDALAILFKRHHQFVFKVARKIVGDVSEAEDLTQSVFLELLHSCSKFEVTKGTAKNWILLHAQRRAINRRQYLALRKPPAQEVSTFDAALPAFNWNGLNQQESARLVQQAISTLHNPQRRALELAFYEGLSMADIAERMVDSIPNVRHHYYRGLAKLRSIIYPNLQRPTRVAQICKETANVNS